LPPGSAEADLRRIWPRCRSLGSIREEGVSRGYCRVIVAPAGDLHLACVSPDGRHGAGGVEDLHWAAEAAGQVVGKRHRAPNLTYGMLAERTLHLRNG
jgi:hypothetical protein